MFEEIPPGAHRFGKLLENVDGRFPTDARVGDADSLLESRGAFRGHFLVAFIDVGFDHDANDACFAFAELVANRLGDFGLVAMVLVGIAWMLSVGGNEGQIWTESTP